ncbi:MAG: hypothetical protein OEV91_11010 [Desulfobulbaceae bacterium]|nr:hypothetical protein [Desulfobulbaceae bacterium]
MKKVIFLILAGGMFLSAFSAAVQATPEIAERTDKACGECHSGGRHHGR